MDTELLTRISPRTRRRTRSSASGASCRGCAIRPASRRVRAASSSTPAPTREPTAPGQFGRVLLRDQLERAFVGLTLEQRAVIVLRHFLDLKREDVAKALGVPVGTVDSRLSRALAKLRDALQADESVSAAAPQEVAS